MKRSNSKSKAFGAFKKLGAVALITATMCFTACKQTNGGGGGEKPAPTPKHAITFSVDSTTPNGTLKAVLDGGDIASGNEVEEGKTVTFTAVPSANYKVKEWKVGDTVVTGNKTNTYAHTVKKAVTVKVSFESNGTTPTPKPNQAILTLDPNKLTIEVKAKTADGSAITVEGCDETTLTSDVKTTLTATGTRVVLKGKITELYCYWNNLVALNVQGLTALQKLNCSTNQLTELNVQGLTALKILVCSSNQLTELNVQGLTSLEELYCSENKLTELNVQGLTALQKLFCQYNTLTELNVQGLTALKNLWCYRNKLTALNVQGLTSLRSLDCGWNKLTSLNVQGLSSLQELKCHKNQLTSLDVQGLTSLQRLYCMGNQLNAQAMTKLLNALPTREASNKGDASLYDETGSEGNCKDFSQPAELKKAFDGAKKKNWKLQKGKGSGIFEDL